MLGSYTRGGDLLTRVEEDFLHFVSPTLAWGELVEPVPVFESPRQRIPVIDVQGPFVL